MTGILATAFMVGSVLLLALLWRRGPARRKSFFGAGLLLAAAAMVVSFAFDELDRRGVALPAIAIDALSLPEFELSLPQSSTGSAPAATADRVREWVGEVADVPLEATLPAVLETVDCRERSGAMRPAADSMECDLLDGTVLRVARFGPSQGPQAWFRKKTPNAVALPADEADASCRLGEPAPGLFRDGEFICWQQGTAARVGWTDREHRLAGVLASTSLDLGEVYRRWRDGKRPETAGASVAP